ncbi:hypothetical protein L228DRAFT_128900 [Xylona heveae TC161]|uniref:Uncharacterized protein n=1 Tax=Xylona heveae (strain CBS 132557 / TC161) TaxID=1328760 RepID=A0A165GTE5_XYLHT|nr:hypothetical protein L228DRAFT_128900 [Xylona heveae TC161]KZF22573.1 hypothetical protein L228DRAFT_128900 [Xylona heveae TC161]
MTTRSASRAVSVISARLDNNITNSIQGSAADARRRSSASTSTINVGASEPESVVPPNKRARLSTTPSNGVSEDQNSIIINNHDDEVKNLNSPPIATFSPLESRASSRKRSIDEVGTDTTTNLGREATSEVQQQEQQPNVVLDAEDEPPLKKRRGRKPKNATNGDASSAAMISTEEIAPVKRPPGRPPGRSAVGKPSANQLGPGKGRRGFPGKRRAPHPDARIEADLIRQSQLKRAYRVVARGLKTALIELGERTEQTLEDDPEAHVNNDAHQVIQDQLDARLAERLAFIQREHQIEAEHQQRKLEFERELIRQMFQQNVANLQEDYLIRGKHELMELYRSQTQRETEGDVTESEVGRRCTHCEDSTY